MKTLASEINNIMCAGYGYSIWYVPYDYKHIQDKYNMKHIPHITLEANLSLRDAFHIYHHQNSVAGQITVKFDDPKFITFPSYYENDPLLYCGWRVHVIEMKHRKPKWCPHMSVIYKKRTDTMIKDCSHMDVDPPQGNYSCFLAIADTRNANPANWHIRNMYFNIKASQSYTLNFDISGQNEKRITSTVDEYFGTNVEELQTFRTTFRQTMKDRGITLTEPEITSIMKTIQNSMVAKTNDNPYSSEMECD